MTGTVVRHPEPVRPGRSTNSAVRWWSRRPGPGRVAGNAVVVLAFVLAGWWVEPVREVAGLVGPLLPVALYGLAVAALILSWVRRPGQRADQRIADGVERYLIRLAGRRAPAAAVLAYLVPLFAGWETARSPYMVGGVIPWSDATLYFGGAQRLLFAGGVDDYGASRPINPAFLAARLAVAGFDLRKALLIGSVLLGIACFLAARTVAQDLGTAAGLALFAGIYGFAAPAAGNVMTESLGATFGALSLASMWAAVRSRNLPVGLAGLVLMTIAQCVRSGTLLVLPALAVWMAYHYRRKGARLDWRVLGLSVAAIALGLAINVGAVLATNGRMASLNGHSGFVLYGLATGHPSWDPLKPNWGRIFEDNPGVSMTGADGSKFVNEEAVRAIRANPVTFAEAVARSGVNYLRGSYQAAFAPIRSTSVRRSVAGVALLGAGALLLARRRAGALTLATDVTLMAATVVSIIPLRDPWRIDVFPAWLFTAVILIAYVAFIVVGTRRLASRVPLSLAVVGLAACAVSAPLLGADRDSARNFAATVPMMALPLAMAVGVLTRVAAGSTPTEDTVAAPGPMPRRSRGWPPVLVGAGIVATSLVGAPVAAAVVDTPAPARHQCPDGTAAHAFVGGVAIRIVGNEPRAENRLDELESHLLEKWAPTLAYGWRPNSNAEPTPALAGAEGAGGRGTGGRGARTMLSAITTDGNDRIAYINGTIDAPRGSLLYLCGQDETGGISAVYSRVFWPEPVTFAFFTGSPLPSQP